MNNTPPPLSLDLEANQEYNLLMSAMNVSVSKHLLDEHFTVVWANDRYYQMFGYTREEYRRLFGDCCDWLCAALGGGPDWSDLAQIVAGAVAAGERKYEAAARVAHRDGRRLWVKLTGNVTHRMVDGVRMSYLVMMDLTEQMQRQVEQSVTYNNLPGFIAKYRITPEGFTFLEGNERFLSFFASRLSFTLEELEPARALALPADAHPLLRQGQPSSILLTTRDRAGREAYMRVNGECLDWVGGDPIYLFLYDDITALTQQRQLLEETNRRLEYLAYTDPVTGGYNRAKFERAAARAIRSAPAGSYTMVWLNLDKFKLINGSAGSEQGDRTLKHIYAAIRRHLAPDEFVGRVEADNFALLLRGVEREAMAGRLQDIAEDVNAFNLSRVQKYILTFNAGLYRVDDPDIPVTVLQDRAHMARKGAPLYGGSGRLCRCRYFTDQTLTRLISEKDMENRMRDALNQRQFVVYLQPKLSLKTGRIAGAEALVRWRTSDGLIPPDQFIPLFERNGFIIPLDLFVFETVCTLLGKWRSGGVEPVPVSVNMSRAHFAATDSLGPYIRLLERYGVPPELVEIELTETMVFADPKAVGEMIRAIHQTGMGCSMDDFGSGYSSLNMLKDLDVDVMKLDRAFCSTGGVDNPKEKTVIRSVIRLARDLGIRTVAEGVETAEQEAFLREADCDMTQGYFFSRPVPVADFERLAWGRELGETE